MRMIDLAAGTGSSQRGTLPHIINNNNRIIDTTTSVDCVREQVRFRRSSFRSLVGCMLPYCCAFPFPTSIFQSSSSSSSDSSDSSTLSSASASSSTSDTDSTTSTSTTVTGTFFGYRKGRVSFCLQDDSRSSPLLLLEFAVQTAYLAKEMQHGQLRIALECDDTRKSGGHHDVPLVGDGCINVRSSSKSSSSSSSSKRQRHQQQYYSCSLYNVPTWSMYCNGRKVGYAMRRQMTVSDLAVLKLMQSVSVGAGVLPNGTNVKCCTDQKKNQMVDAAAAAGDLMYLRASFQRVIGSVHSHSFHMINPAGSSAQELSIFLLRSS